MTYGRHMVGVRMKSNHKKWNAGQNGHLRDEKFAQRNRDGLATMRSRD